MVTVGWRRRLDLWMTGRSCWWSLAEVSVGVGLFIFLAEEVGVSSGCSCENLQVEVDSTGSWQRMEDGGGG